MRILLVRIFYYYAFSLDLTYTYRYLLYLRWYQKERKQRKHDVWG